MISSLKTSFLGALQAALSVLLTLFYGVVAARYGFIHEASVKDISQLCVKIFLPALLLTNVGEHLSVGALKNYIPVFIWALVYAFASMAIGMGATKFLKLPAWVTPAMAFNNTTSLPLLLVTSLAGTGVLKQIVGADVDMAVNRAKSYFLINSMVSNTLTFALGPKLMDTKRLEIEDECDNHEGNTDDNEADERTPLLPHPVAIKQKKIENALTSAFHKLPLRLQTFLSTVVSSINPPLQGAILAAVIGLTPCLHRAFFADMDEGGWMRAWLTSSLKNVGELFTALQMFVVGSELYKSISQKDEEVEAIPKRALGIVFVVRFLLWPVISISLVYFLVAKTTLLGEDPMVWFAMMLMPAGPPAMMLGALMELNRVPEKQKMAVARVLTYFYAVTPVICIAVVGSLNACEVLLGKT